MFELAAKLSELPEDDLLAVEVNGVKMVIYRSGDAIRACQRFCPHQHADLSEGLVSKGFLICSSHGWRFDADSGAHEMSESCLTHYEVRVEGNHILINPASMGASNA